MQEQKVDVWRAPDGIMLSRVLDGRSWWTRPSIYYIQPVRGSALCWSNLEGPPPRGDKRASRKAIIPRPPPSCSDWRQGLVWPLAFALCPLQLQPATATKCPSATPPRTMRREWPQQAQQARQPLPPGLCQGRARSSESTTPFGGREAA